MLGGASRISKAVASRIPEDRLRRLSGLGQVVFPKGGVIIFLLGWACFSQEKNGCCSMELYSSTWNTAAAPPSLSSKLPTTSDHAALPLPKPKVSGRERETCVLAL